VTLTIEWKLQAKCLTFAVCLIWDLGICDL